MKKLSLQLPSAPASSYPIIIGGEMIQGLEKIVKAHFSQHRFVIITDHHVKKIIGADLAYRLLQRGYEVLLLSFPAGEKFKTAKTKERLEQQMLQHHCGRDTLVLALGGGVVGDVAGFVAATYLRGIPYIQLPTTLLAMVDSSIGGKTGINSAAGKNLIGAFWQPSAVIADFTCFKTLSQKQFINGLIEAVKMFLTYDPLQFSFVEQHLEELLARKEVVLEKVIREALQIKKSVVEKDEKEKGERMSLNFGHTIGHALEQVSRYKILHGYAVALGILVEAKISELLGILPREDYEVLQTFFSRLEITPALFAKYDLAEIVAATRNDKKRQAGIAHYVLLRRLGNVERTAKSGVYPVEDAVVKKAIKAILCF